jgi:hypothetical protein
VLNFLQPDVIHPTLTFLPGVEQAVAGFGWCWGVEHAAASFLLGEQAM